MIQMRRLRMLRYRLRSLLRRRSVDDETERELSLHFEQLVREHLRDGVSEADARRAARIEFGSPDLARDQCRDARRVGLIDDLMGDVAYGARVLTRTPAFTATAVLSIALGIGANTAIFSVVDAVVIRSLPVHRPQDLVFVHIAGSRGLSGAPPYPCIQRFETASSAFTGMAAYATDELRIDVDGTAEQVFGQALAAIGLYGVISYTVARRRAEIGIRLALGARRATIAASVCREVLLQVGAGLVIGVPLAIAAVRAARTMLFGVTPNDAGPYAIAAIVVVLVAAAATWIPIRRAVSIDPLKTLRSEL